MASCRNPSPENLLFQPKEIYKKLFYLHPPPFFFVSVENSYFFFKIKGRKTPFGWPVKSLKTRSSSILPSGNIRATMDCSTPCFLFWPARSLLQKEKWLVEKKQGDKVLPATFFFYKIGDIFTPFCSALCFPPAPAKHLSLCPSSRLQITPFTAISL